MLQYIAKVIRLLLPGRFKEPHRANPTTGVGSLDPSWFTSMVT